MGTYTAQNAVTHRDPILSTLPACEGSCRTSTCHATRNLQVRAQTTGAEGVASKDGGKHGWQWEA